MSTIKLSLTRLWLIRSPSPGPHRAGRPTFWVAGNEWNGSPMHATLFPSEEAAQRQIDDARHHKRAGFTGVAEAVPLEGAVRTLGVVFDLREGRADG